MSFDPESILASTYVRQIEYPPKIDSTNNHAIEILKRDSPALPLLVLTDNQSAGRGQRERRWISGTGSLTFSVCYNASEPLLPAIVALSICQTIESSSDLRPQIKWPNDVLIQQKKVAGILIERIQTNPSFALVIGIGINLNNTISAHDLRESESAVDKTEPTSIVQQTGREINPNEFLIGLLNRLEQVVEQWRSTPNLILEEINSRFAFLDQTVHIDLPNGNQLVGINRGLQVAGALRLESPDCSIKSIVSGRMKRRRES